MAQAVHFGVATSFRASISPTAGGVALRFFALIVPAHGMACRDRPAIRDAYTSWNDRRAFCVLCTVGVGVSVIRAGNQDTNLADLGRALPPWTEGSAHHMAERRRTAR